MSLPKNRTSKDGLKNAFAMIVGAVGVLFIAAIFFPVFASAHEVSRRTMTLSNCKQCAMAMGMYQSDNEDIFPFVNSSDAVPERLKLYWRNAQIWDTRNTDYPATFEFNPCLPGTLLDDVPNIAETPMFFDPMPRGWWDNDGAHWTNRVVAFADGHAKGQSEDAWHSEDASLHLKLAKHGKPLK